MKPLNGLLPVFKSSGVISKDVSRRLGRILGKVKMGHVGTLDPMAEGVLPILLGSATRLQDYLLDCPKSYRFTVKFGHETDTLDREGKVVESKPYEHITGEAIEAVIAQFEGTIEQIPPMYSAVKLNGKPLYRYARENLQPNIERKKLARTVTVHELDMIGFRDDQASFEVSCSKGTYVRVLAKDIAQALGSCGTVVQIIRTAAAGLTLKDCIRLEDCNAQKLQDAILSPEELSFGMTKWRSIAPSWSKRLRAGQKLLVHADHFAKCVETSSTEGLLRYAEKPLLLLDEVGVAFGLGEAARRPNGCFMVVMRRGLSR